MKNPHGILFYEAETMKLGILDFGEIDERSNAIETIHHSIANAVLAEKKGFSRYWLTEHYQPGVAWRNPELVLSLIAASTDSIKVGAAGILVAVNTPYRVAQDFKLLSNLFPDRIDLGFAKALLDETLQQEITGSPFITPFHDRIRKIQDLLTNKIKHAMISPVSRLVPDLWLLGTSASSIGFTIENKMNFSLSLLHNLNGSLPGASVISQFKNTFIEKHGYEPQINIALSVFCSKDKGRIKEEIKTRKNVLLNVHGNPKECMAQIKELSQHYQVKEVMILNLGKDHAEKQFLINELLMTNQILH